MGQTPRVTNTRNVVFKIFEYNDNYHTDNLPICVRGGRNLLPDLWRELGFKKGAEIGTKVGKYAEIICKKMPDVHLYCVDPWMAYSDYITRDERQERYFREAQERLKGHNITFIRKTSMDGVKDFEDNSLDFVYIDGNHRFDYVCPDLIFWGQKVRSGGVIALHDYYHFHWAGVVEAVDAYTKCHHIDPWYVIKEVEPSVFWVKP